MKELTSLIRLKKWALDERRRELAELERLRESLCASAEEIDSELGRERDFVSQADVPPDGFASYLKVTIKKRAQLSRSIEQIDAQISEAQDFVAVEFEAMKQAETALERVKARQAAKEKKAEQATMDEIAGVSHQRSTAQVSY